jgi:cyclic lactone autoinducer peptide
MMKNARIKTLESIAKLSKKVATMAEGKQSMFLSYEPKKQEKK